MLARAAAALLALFLLAQSVHAAGMPVCTELPRVANESLIPEVGPHDPAAVLTTRVEWALGDSSGPFEQEYLVRWKNEVLVRELPEYHTYVLGSYSPEESTATCHTYSFGEPVLHRRAERCPGPSKSVVTYRCKEGSQEQIVSISQPEDCGFHLVVESGRVCTGDASPSSHEEL